MAEVFEGHFFSSRVLVGFGIFDLSAGRVVAGLQLFVSRAIGFARWIWSFTCCGLTNRCRQQPERLAVEVLMKLEHDHSRRCAVAAAVPELGR